MINVLWNRFIRIINKRVLNECRKKRNGKMLTWINKQNRLNFLISSMYCQKKQAMKPKTVQYSIQDPCHEPWNEMKPDASGRFCESCSKTVVDFSTMSDFSIVSFLEAHKNESVCGRFSQDQLEKSYVWMKPPTPCFRIWPEGCCFGIGLEYFLGFTVSGANNNTCWTAWYNEYGTGSHDAGRSCGILWPHRWDFYQWEDQTEWEPVWRSANLASWWEFEGNPGHEAG